MGKRLIPLLGFTIVSSLLVLEPLWELSTSAPRGEYYSHIVLIPLISAYLIYQKRWALFLENGHCSPLGLALLALGAGLYGLSYIQRTHLDQNDHASLLTFAAVVIWVGGIAAFYGAKILRVGLFPILFLLFMVPIRVFSWGRLFMLCKSDRPKPLKSFLG